MRKPKFKKEEIIELIVQNKSQKEIADHFGVHKSAISLTIKKMGLAAVPHAATKGVPEKMVDHSMNVFDQMKKISRAALLTFLFHAFCYPTDYWFK